MGFRNSVFTVPTRDVTLSFDTQFHRSQQPAIACARIESERAAGIDTERRLAHSSHGPTRNRQGASQTPREQ